MGSNRFLFEVLPDLFPYGFLSEIEIQMWARFFNEQKKNTN